MTQEASSRRNEPWVLGISCSHNGSACLLHGDEIVAAIQDERLCRNKRKLVEGASANYCVKYCLEAGAIKPKDLDLVVVSEIRGESPESHLSSWNDIHLNQVLRVGYWKTPVLHVTHHFAHAVSAFATSGFSEAIVLVIDGSGTEYQRLSQEEKDAVLNPDPQQGDWEWLSCYEASGASLKPLTKQLCKTHEFRDACVDQFGSIGSMYGAVGMHIFDHFFNGPGKVMGLAPYGKPDTPVRDWFTIADSGLFHFTTKGYLQGKVACEWPENFQGCADLAAAVQRATESGLLRVLHDLRSRTKGSNLCYAGGVALNSVANEKLVREGGFENVFIFPACEDSGVSVGAAYYGLWSLTGTYKAQELRRDALGVCAAGVSDQRGISNS